MPTYESAITDGILDWFDDQINAGAGTSGYFKLENASADSLCTFYFADPAFSTATSQSMTADSIASSTVFSAGTVAQAGVFDADDTRLVTLTAGVSTGECALARLDLTSGGSITIKTFVVTV